MVLAKETFFKGEEVDLNSSEEIMALEGGVVPEDVEHMIKKHAEKYNPDNPDFINMLAPAEYAVRLREWLTEDMQTPDFVPVKFTYLTSIFFEGNPQPFFGILLENGEWTRAFMLSYARKSYTKHRFGIFKKSIAREVKGLENAINSPESANFTLHGVTGGGEVVSHYSHLGSQQYRIRIFVNTNKLDSSTQFRDDIMESRKSYFTKEFVKGVLDKLVEADLPFSKRYEQGINCLVTAEVQSSP